MLKKMDLLKKIYDRNEETKSFIVKTSINQYTDIFNDLDPSPLKKRDLDQDLIKYLLTCSLDIPLKYMIELHFICPSNMEDKTKEERAKTGLKTFCNLTMLTLKEELQNSYKKAFVYIAIFIILISAAFTFGPVFERNVIAETLREGIFIGGWVFLWEAIAIIFIQRKKPISDFKRFERLSNAEILFIYE